MALADILKLLDDEAQHDANKILSDARVQAEQIVASARSEAESSREACIERARAQAEESVRGARVSARLEQRDRMLARRREHLDAAKCTVVDAIRQLPPTEYSTLIVRQVMTELRDGELVLVAQSAPPELLGLLTEEVARRGLNCAVTVDTEAAITEGVLVKGERMSFAVSASTVVDSRRDEIERRLIDALFCEDDG